MEACGGSPRKGQPVTVCTQSLCRGTCTSVAPAAGRDPGAGSRLPGGWTGAHEFPSLQSQAHLCLPYFLKWINFELTLEATVFKLNRDEMPVSKRVPMYLNKFRPPPAKA